MSCGGKKTHKLFAILENLRSLWNDFIVSVYDIVFFSSNYYLHIYVLRLMNSRVCFKVAGDAHILHGFCVRIMCIICAHKNLYKVNNYIIVKADAGRFVFIHVDT